MPVQVRHEDSELGRWTHAEWVPGVNDPLAGAIDRIWDFEGTLQHARERNFPNGMVELIVQLDEPHRPVRDDVAGSQFPAVCIAGVMTAAEVVEAPAKRCRVLGVRLHPVGAFALLATPLQPLAGVTVDLRDVVGRAAAELGERCYDAACGEQRVRIAARWAVERIARCSHVDPAVAWAARRIAQLDGRVTVAALEADTGRSRARFTAAFREHVGVSPKRYARVVRFRRALELVPSGAPLGEIALAAGYYDQPHMNAEFRAHSGLTPREFLRAVRYPHSVSLAEASV
jgi:AraC-like DNA-binding protein